MLNGFTDQIQLNILFKDLTTVGIGGPAKQLITTTSPDDLLKLLKLVHLQNIPYFLMGGGSNLLVSDEGINKLVIQNKVTGIQQEEDITTVESGTALQNLVDYTISHRLAGIHKMTGIPGTIGGAIYGNAGAYGQTASDYLVEVVAFDGQNEISISKENCQFSYRSSIFKQNKFPILKVKFNFASNDNKTLNKEATEILAKRLISYPSGLRCPGSFFKNILVDKISPSSLKLIPMEKILYGKIPAGYLLEEVGAKKQKLGDIQISPKHANLFINLNDGQATDFWQLAKIYAEKVKEKFGISLEPEVQLINLPPLL